LLTHIRNPKRSLLFIGFRLYDWQLRMLMHVLDRNSDNASKKSRSFALEVATMGLDKSTRNFYSTDHSIDFFQMKPRAFVKELRSRVKKAEGGEEEVEAVSTPVSRPIFICHASQDKEYAADLADRLRANGLEPWLDKEQLRGGDTWDSLIEEALAEVSYVVVLQSRNMVARREHDQKNYVNREIRTALDEQLGLSPKRRFLIPVYIDGKKSLLEDFKLKQIQSIDLDDDDGFDELVSVIRQDLLRSEQTS
jgi:hypothetical protein